MKFNLEYKRKNLDKPNIANISNSLIKLVDDLELQSKKDKTQILSKFFRFSELKDVFNKLKSKGVKEKLTFKGAPFKADEILGACFGRALPSFGLLIKEAVSLRNQYLKNLTIGDINNKIKDKKSAEYKFFRKQGEVYKLSGMPEPKKVEESFFNNLDNLNKDLNEFFDNFNLNKAKVRVIRDIKLLLDEDHRYAKYLGTRKTVKSLLKNVDQRICEVYKDTLAESGSSKGLSHDLNPEVFFGQIHDRNKKTQTSINYNELASIIKEVINYLPNFLKQFKSINKNLETRELKLIDQTVEGCSKLLITGFNNIKKVAKEQKIKLDVKI